MVLTTNEEVRSVGVGRIVWEGILLSSKRIRALVSGQKWGGLERGKDEERGRPRFITTQSGVCCQIEIGRQSNFSYMQHKDVGRRALLESRHLPGPRYVDHGCALRLLLQPCFVAGSHYAYRPCVSSRSSFFSSTSLCTRVPLVVPCSTTILLHI